MIGAAPLSAWTTPKRVDAAVLNLLNQANGMGEYVFSTDFSSYDATLRSNWQQVGWNILKRYYQKEFHSGIDLIAEVFAQIGLVVSVSQTLTGMHGVPSGSVFTNWIDSVVHWVAQELIAARLGSHRLSNSQIQGDDGLLVIPGVRDPAQIESAYASLGFEANADKQFVGTDDCLYLQKYYHLEWDRGGMYPTYRALNSLCSQDRFFDPTVWGPEQVVVRSIMILENTADHPLAQEFFDFVQAGDKYRLGASWPGGIDALLSPTVIQKSESLAGFVPSYNQERRLHGIRQFATYRRIKETET